MATSIYDLKVPCGWDIKIRNLIGNAEAIISSPTPRNMFATVDFSNRGYRLGISAIGPFANTSDGKRGRKLSGLKWRQRLVDNAVARLQAILESM